VKHDCEDRDHKWKFHKAWYGDNNVINGTQDCSFWRCTVCDHEQEEKPDDWEPEGREYESDSYVRAYG